MKTQEDRRASIAQKTQRSISGLGRRRHGTTLAEMGLLAGLVAVVSVGVVATTGEKVGSVYCNASTAMGSDGNCTIEAAAPGASENAAPVGTSTPPPAPFAFEDLALPSSDTGTQTHLVALNGYRDRAGRLTVTPVAGVIAACIQPAEGDAATCNAQTGTPSAIDVPAGTYAAGYSFISGDRYDAYDQDLSIGMKVDTIETGRWDIHVSRAAAPIQMNMTSAFDPRSFPSGTTGQQYLMTPLTGDFNTGMSFIVDASDYFDRACVQATQSGPISCDDVQIFDRSRRIDVAPDDYAVGYLLTLPGNTFEAYAHSFSGVLRSKEGDKPSASWSQDVSRIQDHASVNPGFTFGDYATDPGFMGVQYVLKELGGAANTGVRVAMRPASDNMMLRPCVQEVRGGPINCAPYQGSGRISFIDATQDAFAVGYSIDVNQSWWKQVSVNAEFYLNSTTDSTVTNRYDIQVTRPAKEVVVAATTTFDDIVLPAGTSGPYEIIELLEGNFNTSMNITMDKGNNLVSTCRQLTSNDPVDCNGIEMRNAWRSPVDGDTYAIGYKISLPAAGTAFDRTYTIKLISTADQTTQTWTQRVQRPAN